MVVGGQDFVGVVRERVISGGHQGLLRLLGKSAGTSAWCVHGLNLHDVGGQPWGNLPARLI